MTRTHKYEARFTRNIRREELNVANTGYGIVKYGHNFNKYAFYESCYLQAKDFEDHIRDTTDEDAELMDAQWHAMQDELMTE